MRTDGSLVMRVGGLYLGQGVATGGGRLVLGGTDSGSLLLLDPDYGNPQLTRETERPPGLALDDEGVLWAADENGLHRFPPGDAEGETLAEVDRPTGLAVLGGRLYLADTEGLRSFALPAFDDERVLSERQPALLAACGDELLLYDEDDDALLRASESGQEQVLAEAGATLGTIMALSCVDGQEVVATASGPGDGRGEGTLWARATPAEDFVEVATADVELRHLAPAP